MIRSISLTALIELFDYNYWARDLQIKACTTLTEQQFLRPMGSSFSSLRDTMVHMVAVEWLWLERWRGRSPKSLLSSEEFSTVPAVYKHWCTVENEMRGYLAALDEEAVNKPVTCVNTRGQTWTYTLWRMMLHLLNHQSYHRGQVTTLLRQLEIQPPKVDFLDAHDSGFRSNA
jgi:uncharacterized damage-inducible protein DinB